MSRDGLLKRSEMSALLRLISDLLTNRSLYKINLQESILALIFNSLDLDRKYEERKHRLIGILIKESSDPIML